MNALANGTTTLSPVGYVFAESVFDLYFCYAMLSKGMTLHLSYSGWREGEAGALVITYSTDNWESNDLSRTWL